jgi:hypothetical protein
MSKERALLKRVRDTLHELKETHYDLYWDIQAELDRVPQKREPAQTAREMYQRGYAKAKDDLKREPLSDEWIKDNVHLIHRDVSFTDLVRSIEKAHGIGVENE